jgi:hypothetical protein
MARPGRSYLNSVNVSCKRLLFAPLLTERMLPRMPAYAFVPPRMAIDCVGEPSPLIVADAIRSPPASENVPRHWLTASFPPVSESQ